MPEQDKPSPADLAAELIAAERQAIPAADERPPIVAATDPVGLLLYPMLRRHRKVLLPIILLTTVGLVVVSVWV